MTTRLLPALALTGLLHLSSPALAQDAPNSAHPGPVHTSLGTIQPSDVEAYVDLVFSEQNEGVYRPRDGKIHKVAEPFFFVAYWPECDKTARDVTVDYKLKTGLPINYSTTEMEGDVLTVFVFGINSIDELTSKTSFFDMLKSVTGRKKDELLEAINGNNAENFIFGLMLNNGKRSNAALFIVKNYKHDTLMCKKIFPNIYQQYLTNTKISFGREGISDLDYLFVSALYDQSIQDEESEDSARSKIVTIMLNKLERTK